ncbi:MAG: YIP1 family protein [Proteiniphilum sp.]|jgi:hypothetical protein|nr:YIP1 family protein [Proteiniphilum sp.]
MWRDIFITIAQLIVDPPRAWRYLRKERKTHHEFLYRFLHPVFGLIAASSFVGGLWFVRGKGLENALKSSIISVAGVYGGYAIAAYLLNEIAPRFGLEKNLPRFQRFTGYASVVLYVLYIITPVLSELFVLWFLVLYTIYLVNTGISRYLKVPEEKVTDFTAIASIIIILAPVVVRIFFVSLIR